MSAGKPAILFSGGYGHPFAGSSAALAQIAAGAGYDAAIEEELDAALGRLAGVRLLLVNALYWSMTQHAKYAPHRELWARELLDGQMAALDAFVRGGGSLLVMHTGTICWDTQPGWREIMGGGWLWGVSHHPELGPVLVQPTEFARARWPGLADFRVRDEVYHALGVQQDCRVLATSAVFEAPQPVAWVRRHGAGRVAVNALGHDAASLETPGHAALIAAMLEWLEVGGDTSGGDDAGG